MSTFFGEKHHDEPAGYARPPRFSISTLGCRLNQYESEKIAAELVARGFERVDEQSEAELKIINTCTVTHRADSDSRQKIRQAIRNSPHGAVVVAGCYVDADPIAAAGIDGVSAVIRNREKNQIAEYLHERLEAEFPYLSTWLDGTQRQSLRAPTFDGHNRAWLKLSDGCNQWCSYCILPTVRGRLSNRPPDEILHELHGLISQGYREIVLTGINVGHYSWRQSSPEIQNLAGLIRQILNETEGVRFRLSSIEPQTVRTELRELYADENPRVCRHWHLPLQSGSARILRLMRRPYDPAYYVKLAESLKGARSSTIIGADVIVGFPGESDQDFAHTREICESGLIDYLHVFSYSDRSGTVASAIAEKVRPQVIAERNQILTAISKSIKRVAMQREIGATLPVIAEGEPTDELRFGTSDNFLKVQFTNGGHLKREITPIRIVGMTDDTLIGELETATNNRITQAQANSCL